MGCTTHKTFGVICAPAQRGTPPNIIYMSVQNLNKLFFLGNRSTRLWNTKKEYESNFFTHTIRKIHLYKKVSIRQCTMRSRHAWENNDANFAPDFIGFLRPEINSHWFQKTWYKFPNSFAREKIEFIPIYEYLPATNIYPPPQKCVAFLWGCFNLIIMKPDFVQHKYYVYIMASKPDGVLYIGVTDNIVRRVWEHKNNIIKNSFTARYNVHTLIYW